MDIASDGIVDPTSSFVPAEALALFQRVGTVVVLLASALFAFLVTRKLFFYLTWRSFRDGPYTIGYHQWRPGNLAGPHWCNICESTVYGIRSYVVTCDICGMCAHAQCAATTIKPRTAMAMTANGAALAPATPSTAHADDRGACKMAAVYAAQGDHDQQQHLWVKGNIDPMDTCSICGLFCGSILALSGLKCAWCHRRVHENCFRASLRHLDHPHPHHRHHVLRHCDFGRHANLILPPSAVILKEEHQPRIASTSQRALSTVRTAAQIAVNTMSNIRLRRRSSQVPPSTSTLDTASSSPSTAASTPSSSPRASSSEPAPGDLLPPLNLSAMVDETDRTASSSSSSPTASPVKNRAIDVLSTMPFEIVPPKDITPLLVFINSRSGGQLGLHVLRQIRRWLNPIQIYDLSHQSPVAPLLQFKDIPRLRILVCGGDGTVGWVLGALDEIGATRQPPIAILPLGTGNDLARVLGWGSGYSTKDVSEILAEVEAAHVSLLDRWRVEIDGKKHAVLNNYLGVGVDAQVALEFHEQRERSPGLFVSQFVNKLWYSQFGAKNFLMRTCAGLPTKMTLECDGKLIALPEGTEGVILLNINSYGGGSTLWHDDSDSEEEVDDDDEGSTSETDDGSVSDGDGFVNRVGSSSPHDGFLDVVAVYGTLHLGQMQVGLSKAVRLCQAKRVTIRLHEKLPVQIDGEPWQQNPCEIDIAFHQQAFMLSRTVQEKDFVTRRVGQVLDWAETTGVISSSQCDILLAEIARRVADNDTSNRSSLPTSGSSSSSSSHWRRDPSQLSLFVGGGTS